MALIAVATALPDGQLAAQAAAFEQEGGFTERLYRKRRNKTQGAGGHYKEDSASSAPLR